MAIYARSSIGSGNIVGNEGLAGSGTLLAGEWRSGPDRIYLYSPKIKWDHHPSMYNENGAISGGVLAKNANGILMSKGDRYLIWDISGTVLRLRRSFIHSWETPHHWKIPTPVEHTEVWWEELKSEPGIFDPTKWHVFSFSMDSTTWALYVDGEIIADREMASIRDVEKGEVMDWPDEGDPLYVGPISGDIDEIIFLNRNFGGGMTEFLHVTSGTWESPVYDLGGKYALHKITWEGYINSWMSATVLLRLSDTSDFEYFDEIRFSLEHDTDTYYPHPSEWIAGKYLKVIVRLNREDLEWRRPYIDYIWIYLRKVPQ